MTVLLAEDDPSVSNLVQRALESNGHEVLVCSNGRDALEAFIEHRESIDRVVSDIEMPEMDGRELGVRLQRLAPELDLIFLTSLPEAKQRLRRAGVRKPRVLRKPIGLAELQKALR